jgi:DNA-binding transcriptional ArsR family regulator
VNLREPLTYKQMLISIRDVSSAGKQENEVFRAVADPTRRALLDLLIEREQSVNELHGRFRVSQPAISQHLDILRRAGLVRAQRDGRRVLYGLNARPLEQIYRWAATYKAFFDPQGHAWAFRGVQQMKRG